MNKSELEELTDGLLFMSESDEELEYVELNKERSQLWPPKTADLFLKLIDKQPETPVEEVAIEQFFEELIPGNEDREDQVRALHEAFTTELVNVRCYRVGEIEIEIYLIGQDASGRALGLQTLSVET